MTMPATTGREAKDGAVTSGALVEVRNLVKTYGGHRARVRGEEVQAVADVSFDIVRGETLGIVGESGSGKSTVARIIIGLETPTAGTVRFDGLDVHQLGNPALRGLRRRQQLVFQDPMSSLNRRKTVAQSIEAPMIVHGIAKQARVARVRQLLELVGLHPGHSSAYPRQLSGGQAQRVAIARALALDPEFVVLDEAVSSLDVSVQAQILNLLKDLQATLGLTYLFIAHDLAIVHFMATRIAVMYSGRVVEFADRAKLFDDPQHDYTRSLLAAIPEPNPERAVRRPPALAEPPAETA
ncbi:MAG: peptide/nickel transport system ATP-binding protein [Solirubrobacteraceae bacterium]